MDFKILLEKITPALRAIARKHVFYSFYDAEDLFQEMCLFLWNNYSQGMPIGINEAYVIKGCEFHILNFLRKGRPKALILSIDEIVTPEGLKLGDVLEDKRNSRLTNADQNIGIEDIKNAGLTDREKRVFSLLLEGKTAREAAKELGISHVMVLKYKKKIMQKWQKKVTKIPDNLL
ncbi:MAG: sigma-70 family RNA polymerase sigma factor [Candidatus Omnitrophica bacterium]|nr:sigma-70 family RNA polymerase sigma factor [Candidatus Omnitrophota bacterium]